MRLRLVGIPPWLQPAHHITFHVDVHGSWVWKHFGGLIYLADAYFRTKKVLRGCVRRSQSLIYHDNVVIYLGPWLRSSILLFTHGLPDCLGWGISPHMDRSKRTCPPGLLLRLPLRSQAFASVAPSWQIQIMKGFAFPDCIPFSIGVLRANQKTWDFLHSVGNIELDSCYCCAAVLTTISFCRARFWGSFPGCKFQSQKFTSIACACLCSSNSDTHSLSAWRSEKLQKVYHYTTSDRQTLNNFGSIFLNFVRFTSCWLLTSEAWPRPNQPNPVKHNRTTCYGWQFSQTMFFFDPPPLCFELYSNLASKDVTDGISVVSPRESVAVAVEPGIGDEKTLPIQLQRFFVCDLHVHLQHLHLVHLAELEILAKIRICVCV